MAWKYVTDGAGAVNRHEMQLEEPEPHEIRVSVKAVGLNFRDNYFVHGNGFRAPAIGRVPCTDAVGMVTQVGSQARRFKVGDRVCSIVLPRWLDGPLTPYGLSASLGSEASDGVLASELQAHEDIWVHAPGYLSSIEAATLPVAAVTAWHAIVELRALRAGQTVVIQTTGGVALFAAQFAIAIGARVVVVSRSDSKLNAAIRLGVWRTINSEQIPEWDNTVVDLTGGEGAELVLDMGLTDGLRRSARATAFEGTVAVIGVVQEHTNALDIFPVMNKNLRVRGVETGSRAMFERMNAFMSERQIRPVVDRVFAPDEVQLALAHLNSSPFGKVVIGFE